MFGFCNYSAKSKFYNYSNKLVIGKIKDETSGVAIKEFVRLKPKMYFFLVEDNSEHKKPKGMNRNFAAKISHGEYKDVLINKKCLRHSMNSIQNKDQRIGTYEIKKTSLAYFHDKIYILNNGYDKLALGYQC